jgi:hypothetical protein
VSIPSFKQVTRDIVRKQWRISGKIRVDSDLKQRQMLIYIEWQSFMMNAAVCSVLLTIVSVKISQNSQSQCVSSEFYMGSYIFLTRSTMLFSLSSLLEMQEGGLLLTGKQKTGYAQENYPLTFLPPHLHVSVVTIYTNSRIIHLQG